ncbi:MAG: hypothetical protein UX26_C0005G0012 [Parcubacteria group bacterium GW2011_GWC1_45_9]|nr:MAG: hypothetical protein UW85_C0001G0051 [Parcubacteria group bacterium GW2011_GWA1_Parcubacteria_45_10]KKT89286.1 MAG: hypothetical protein UW89_C0001G0014 [Parcubacteria group bacterium GW2011_GWB1_45_10]KKU17216.1 MAG: hypothetical protein UX26_C0005G0012 [Parcubacteria group bacterium GW2011_GWC1_45_9]HCI05497.1 hypothetical protein [Patescibacteria group bacterium]
MITKTSFKKTGLILTFLSVFLVGFFLKLGWDSAILAFAEIFNPKINENELQSRIIRLEETLASKSWRDNFGVKAENEAEIIGFLIGSGGKKVFINRGSADNLSVGDWVIVSENTLFGRVERAEKDFSVVKTIFDPSLKIATRIQADPSLIFNGVFYFDGSRFVVDFLPKETEISETAFVETSGKDGVFKSGFYLGSASSLENSSEVNLKKAVVEVPFKIGEIFKVSIVKNIFSQ